MKTLLILRHAKSKWGDPQFSDHDRPLNKRGKRDAPRIASLMREQNLIPDVILSSTAQRARTTAEEVARTCDCNDVLSYTSQFYHAPPESYLQELKQLSDELTRVLVVGHNPGLEELLALLTREYEILPTATLARVSLSIDKWSETCSATRGTLVDLWRPRELDPN